jgi:hypothetical protein
VEDSGIANGVPRGTWQIRRCNPLLHLFHAKQSGVGYWRTTPCGGAGLRQAIGAKMVDRVFHVELSFVKGQGCGG